MAAKPRVRVQAQSRAGSGKNFTADNFTNFNAGMGYGAQNLLSGGSYGFNPITRNHILLEWAYRGNWLVRKIVDAVAQDMTREGINIESEMAPERIDELTKYWMKLQIWQRLCSTIKWSRLYGGCVAVLMIEGQNPADPLRIDTVGKGQFKGLMVLDRWMLWPLLEDLVTDFGPDYLKPRYYDVVADARAIPSMRIHHSRCMRFDGVELPYWQAITENLWGLSVVEPLFDRLVSWDSVTMGAANLAFKAHLRVLKLDGWRELIAMGGKPLQAVQQYLQQIRLMQSNEGLTVLDIKDEFEANAYGFGGLSDMMVQFAQQVSGASDVPMTRLFAQSPAGLNSTGESDLRNYYDMLKGEQEAKMRHGINILLNVSHRSLYGQPLPDDFNFEFAPLWQNTEVDKAQIASTIAQAADGLTQSGIFTPVQALKEIRQWSRITGFGTNIEDEDIEAMEAAPPMPGVGELGGGMEPPEPGGAETEGQSAPGAVPAAHGALSGPDRPKLKQPEPGAEEDDAPLENVGGQFGNEVPGIGAREQAEAGPFEEGEVGPLLSRVQINYDPDDLPQPEDFAALSNVTGPDATVEVNYPHESPSMMTGAMDRRFTQDQRSVVDVYGLQCVVETPKGVKRRGYGWADTMPVDYGRISAGRDSMGAFVGSERDSRACYVIEQIEPDSGMFDANVALLGFAARDAALAAYKASFGDGRGVDRIGSVKEMDVGTLREWLQNNWKYGREMVNKLGNDV